MFEKQWFINHGAADGSDMNVIPAWRRGFTGKGVVVTILDDGIQSNHPDLRLNYDPKVGVARKNESVNSDFMSQLSSQSSPVDNFTLEFS